jgi:hypothetical protein
MKPTPASWARAEEVQGIEKAADQSTPDEHYQGGPVEATDQQDDSHRNPDRDRPAR